MWKRILCKLCNKLISQSAWFAAGGIIALYWIAIHTRYIPLATNCVNWIGLIVLAICAGRVAEAIFGKPPVEPPDKPPVAGV